MNRERAIERLRDDKQYYGAYGKQFFSSSDIRTLVREPDRYGKFEETLALVQGRYLHERLLRPELFYDNPDLFPIAPSHNRMTRLYKDFVQERGGGVYLLKHEVKQMEWLMKKVEANDYFMQVFRKKKSLGGIEEPMIGKIQGRWFKGKADRIREDLGFVADFKTTKGISTFSYSAREYFYDVQGYVYSNLFELPWRAFVLDKETGRLGVFDLSDEFLQRGAEKVERALENFDMYYGDNPSSDINQYYVYDLL